VAIKQCNNPSSQKNVKSVAVVKLLHFINSIQTPKHLLFCLAMGFAWGGNQAACQDGGQDIPLRKKENKGRVKKN